MKIQIDTDNKTIKLEDNISLNELFKKIKKLFPDNEWKEYKLETNTTIQTCYNPIKYIEIEKYKDPIYPPYPWITCETTCESTYNIQC